MISSPDLLPFTVQGGFGDPEDGEAEGAHRRPAGGLFPEEFSVPPPPGCEGHPWSSAAPFHKDFVLVAEFSEQVGPTPVMTIPDEAGAGGSLDLNHFSVRIMSVDYQASGPGGPSPSASGPRLNFNKDSEVVLGDSAERAFAYVRHVTLLDPAARGMVRPFCLAYVCSQQAKIMDNFGRLSAGFGRAAESLKTGNRQAFSLELHGELHRMQYERLALLRDAGMGEKRQELEALERAMAVHQELLRQVACYPNRKLKRPDFLPYEPADARTDAPATPPPAGPERRLKPIWELCNGYFLSLMTEQLARTELRLRGDVTALRGASITRSLWRRLKLTNFLFEQPEEEEEEDDGEEMSTESANGPSSESRAQAEEAASGEMTGSISSGDSFQVMATERSYRTLAAPAAPLASSLDAAPSDGEPLATSGVWPGSRDTPPPSLHSPPVSGRANGEDGIEVLGATESVAPEDLAAFTEEEPSEDDETAKSADWTPDNFPAGRRSSAQSEKGAGRAEAGLLARRFSERHSFSQQVVFCLLSGRPLVLLSADEGKLRSAADALTLFLPAPAGAVAPCLRAPPRLADLLRWRLIGFHRSRSSDPLDWLDRYGRYLAVLDLDRRTLRCPPYSGSLAGSLVGSAAPAAAFLPRVRSGLTALANRALLFTFARRGDDDGDDADGLDAGDVAVMRFLSDLIKRRHAGRGPPALRFSYVALRLHKDTSAA